MLLGVRNLFSLFTYSAKSPPPLLLSSEHSSLTPWMKKPFSSGLPVHGKQACILALHSLQRPFQASWLQISEQPSILRSGRMQGNVRWEQNGEQSHQGHSSSSVSTRSWHSHRRQLAAVGRSVAEAWQKELCHNVLRITPQTRKQMKQGCFPSQNYKSRRRSLMVGIWISCPLPGCTKEHRMWRSLIFKLYLCVCVYACLSEHALCTPRGQKKLLISRNWSSRQLQAAQCGYLQGQEVSQLLSHISRYLRRRFHCWTKVAD